MDDLNRDIRWIQRFSNYSKALGQLTEFIQKKSLNKLEQQGLVQAFEYTHELAWKTLKDFLEYKGSAEVYGSKDVTRESFKLGLVANGEVWMDMIKSRNLTSHTYNEDTTNEIISAIQNKYYTAFEGLHTKLTVLKKDELNSS